MAEAYHPELMCLRESERARDLQVVQDAGQDCDRMFRLLYQGAHFGGPRGALLQGYLHGLPRFPKRLRELLREGILKTTKGVLDVLAKRPIEVGDIAQHRLFRVRSDVTPQPFFSRPSRQHMNKSERRCVEN